MLAAQAWIVFLLFLISIVYSIVMTVKSSAFRKLYDLTGGWMITYFFIVIFVMGVLLLYGTHCAVVGESGMPFCSMYSWVITLLTLCLMGLFIGQSLYTHLKENDKVVDQEQAVLQEA